MYSQKVSLDLIGRYIKSVHECNPTLLRNSFNYLMEGFLEMKLYMK